MIDNTMYLTLAVVHFIESPAASVVQDAPERIEMSHQDMALSLIKSVHRSFFSSVMIGTEKGLDWLCARADVTVESSIRRQLDAVIDKIAADFDADTIRPHLRAIKNLRSNLITFQDYLNTAMEHTEVADDFCSNWRDYFRALSIIRNKASHSKVTLTDTERQDLRKARFDSWIDDRGELQLNTLRYAEVSARILDFFDVMCQAPARRYGTHEG
jgi:hypothetical protein